MVMPAHRNIKVYQDKEPRKPEIGPPEGIRNPGIQVCVIGRWSIIGNHRRSLIVIIIIFDRRVRIIRACCLISTLP